MNESSSLGETLLAFALYFIGIIVLLVLVFSTGCAPAPDMTSTRGASSYFHGLETGLDRSLLDDMEGDLINGLEVYGYAPGTLSASLTGYVVDWQKDYFHCIGVDAMCAGQNFGDNSWVVALPVECPWLSAYRHEMLHYLQSVYGIVDTEHTTPEWVVVNSVADCTGGRHSDPIKSSARNPENVVGVSE